MPTLWEVAFAPEIRQRALELYVEHGPAEASRRLKAETEQQVRAGTITEWARRAGVVNTRIQTQAAAVEASKLSNEAKRERLRDELLDLALDTAGKAKRSAKARERRDHAGSVAIFVDKFELLDGRATQRIEGADVNQLKALRDQVRDDLAVRRQQRSA